MGKPYVVVVHPSNQDWVDALRGAPGVPAAPLTGAALVKGELGAVDSGFVFVATRRAGHADHPEGRTC